MRVAETGEWAYGTGGGAMLKAGYGMPESATFYVSAHGPMHASLLCREWARRMAVATSRLRHPVIGGIQDPPLDVIAIQSQQLV